MGRLRLGHRTLLYEGKFVRLLQRPFTNSQTGETGHWEYLQRKVCGRIVAVAAVTKARELVLVKIFRIPLDGYIIECCAGLADQFGEDEIALARRELLEETGYECETLQPIMWGPFNAGLNADEIIFYLGTGAEKTAEPRHEAAEDIEVVLVPVDELESFLARPPRGTKIDVKLWSLLHFLPKIPLVSPK